MTNLPFNALEPRRYSGIRFKSQQHQNHLELDDKARKIATLHQGVATSICQEPFAVDDWQKMVPTEFDFWRNQLAGSEIYLMYDVYTNVAKTALMGVAGLSQIIPNRHAKIWLYAAPEYRGKEWTDLAMVHVLKYAFDPLGNEGLGLLKVKAEVAIENKPAIGLLTKMGFISLCIMPLEGCYHSGMMDMMLLELQNPSIFGTAGEKINASEYQCDRDAGELLQSAGVGSAGVQPANDNAIDDAGLQPVSGDGPPSEGDRRSNKRKLSRKQRTASRVKTNRR